MRAQTQWRTFLRESPAYPPKAFEGQGVVILAGGLTYMVPAWVNIHMLRRTGAILDYVVCALGQHPHAAQKRACTITFRMVFACAGKCCVVGALLLYLTKVCTPRSML